MGSMRVQVRSLYPLITEFIERLKLIRVAAGRFFASNEIKILFSVLLLKYDWRYEPGYTPPNDIEFEAQVIVPQEVKVQCRRRQEEIDLMEPKDLK